MFPNLALWNSRDPNDPAGQIDRALNDRNHRLIVGISISDSLDKVRGALVVSQGNGKYLRVRHVVNSDADIPNPIREGILEVIGSEQRDLNQCDQLLSDLAEIQALVVSNLQREAGKYVDRVLAVAVCDPGFWSRDFDGRVGYSPMCDSTQLAERSGISVIHSFPSRDLAVGGNGQHLQALPFWLLFADRHEKKADLNQALIVVGGETHGYRLPPSDGLDSEVPSIQTFHSVGLTFLDILVRRFLPANFNLNDFDQIYADGKILSELTEQLDGVKPEEPNQHESGYHQQLARISEKHLQESSHPFSSVLRSGIEWVANRFLGELDELQSNQFHRLLISCPPQYEACLVNRLNIGITKAEDFPVRKAGCYRDDMHSVVAALLGLCHIDQLPANVPWITGADSQRILGKLTPGRPSNWRQLVRAMADFHPAPMKLKDAV